MDPDEQMLTKHCISRPVSRSDQDRNAKTTGMWSRFVYIVHLHILFIVVYSLLIHECKDNFYAGKVPRFVSKFRVDGKFHCLK